MAACLYFANNGTARLDVGISPDQCRNYIVLQRDEYQHYQAMYQASIAPYDYLAGAEIFGFFFSFTLGVWIVARNAGEVMAAVKRF